ncbi:MAG: DNA topoisomerase IV subunit A [Pseudomonadota bacterium]|nr:DNA topoisomerase IV subunit A [Pseudomonadota bacterium]
MDTTSTPTPLREAARRRYLNYAVSVITSRALPDVRDGLKPVQRRILYAMFHNLHLTPEARYKKCAAIVGEVLGKYHPHGDSSVYEALVRMAQDFSLLHPLVDGQGNFGSIDGDNAAAYRYTEARLTPIAMELLTEIKQKTVGFRPNFDGQHFEPIVMPAQFPHLLVNGTEGIAVGMATRIPPHNLREIIDACLVLIAKPDATVLELCKKVRAPDFPTGGEIVSGADEIRQVYEDGQGPIRVRGTWETEQKGRKHFAIITSVPYAVVKAQLVEKIGEIIREKKCPQLVDVRDESTTDVRVVLELRAPEDAPAAMAFLYKHTAFQTQFNVNLTCLVPTDNPEVGAPRRLNLKEILEEWLKFRHITVRKRLDFELSQLRERIHVLEGFAKVFDILDECIRIIRASEGKRDAAEKLMDRFGLDDLQADAILELKLYRLARLEINLIREELAEKGAAAERIESVLASSEALWSVVERELQDIRKQHGQARRTALASDAPAITYDEQSYIVAEDTIVVVTRGGWIKRQGTVTGIEKVRVREGDSIGWIFRATTVSTVTLLSNQGTAYVLRVDAITPTTGHGEPVQRHFTFADNEQIIGVISNDPRNLPAVPPDLVANATDEAPAPPHIVAMSRQGRIVRTPLALHAEQSNKNGRRYMRLEEEGGDEVVAAYASGGNEDVCVASFEGSLLCFPVWDVTVIRAAGKGVIGIKLKETDRVFAWELTLDVNAGPNLVTALGRDEVVRPSKFNGPRAGKGHAVFRRGHFALWKRIPEVRLGTPRVTEGEA